MQLPWWAFILLALPILPNMWSIWHVHNNEFPTFQEKALWFVTAVFIPVLGGLAYIFFGRRRIKPRG